MPKEVKEIDHLMLTVEAPALLGELLPGWNIQHLTPLPITLDFLTPEQAYEQYMQAYRELT